MSSRMMCIVTQYKSYNNKKEKQTNYILGKRQILLDHIRREFGTDIVLTEFAIGEEMNRKFAFWYPAGYFWWWIDTTMRNLYYNPVKNIEHAKLYFKMIKPTYQSSGIRQEVTCVGFLLQIHTYFRMAKLNGDELKEVLNPPSEKETSDLYRIGCQTNLTNAWGLKKFHTWRIVCAMIELVCQSRPNLDRGDLLALALETSIKSPIADGECKPLEVIGSQNKESPAFQTCARQWGVTVTKGKSATKIYEWTNPEELDDEKQLDVTTMCMDYDDVLDARGPSPDDYDDVVMASPDQNETVGERHGELDQFEMNNAAGFYQEQPVDCCHDQSCTMSIPPRVADSGNAEYDQVAGGQGTFCPQASALEMCITNRIQPVPNLFPALSRENVGHQNALNSLPPLGFGLGCPVYPNNNYNQAAWNRLNYAQCFPYQYQTGQYNAYDDDGGVSVPNQSCRCSCPMCPQPVSRTTEAYMPVPESLRMVSGDRTEQTSFAQSWERAQPNGFVYDGFEQPSSLDNIRVWNAQQDGQHR